MIEGSKSGSLRPAVSRCRVCDQFPGRVGKKLRSIEHLKPGERIEFDDNMSPRLWGVTQGTAAICRTLADGRRQILDLQTRDGVIFSAIVGPRTVGYIEALEASRLCEFRLFVGFSQAPPDRLWEMKILHLFNTQLGRMAAHNFVLGRLDSKERIYWFLAEMARQFGIFQDRSVRVSLPLSRKDIADYLGLNAETVSRHCSAIRKAGLVNFVSPTVYIVPDLQTLERKVPFVPAGALRSEVAGSD